MFIRKRVAWLAAVAAIGIATSGLTGCTAGDDGASKLTVFAPSNPQTNPDMDTNAFTKQMAEQFDIDFQFATTGIESGPATEKRQIALGSGNYPDLFLLVGYIDQFSQAELLKYADQGLVIPLNDLIDEYGPNIKKAFAENPEFENMATAPDGNIYGMPQWSECYHCSFQSKLWMNSAWLETVGLEQPKTTEEMRTVLRAFKDGDPNGNGIADEVPLSADVRDNLVPYFMNAFTYDPQGVSSSNASTLVLDGDKVDLQADDDEWREGLRYLNSLYSEGLIDEAAFTQDADALKTRGDNAEVETLGSAAVLHPAIFVTIDDTQTRHTEYDAVPPLTGPEGANFAGYNFPSSPGATFVLTNKATEEEQIKAIKMLDYFFTDEGQMLGVFGEEGVGWQKSEAGAVALDADTEPLYDNLPPDVGEERNSGWGGLVSFNNTAEFRNAEVISPDPYLAEGYERRLFDATKLYDGHQDESQIFPYWAVWIDGKLGSEVATLQTNIESNIAQSTVEFITGSKSLDNDWEAYKDGLAGLGLERYLEIEQEAYDNSSAAK